MTRKTSALVRRERTLTLPFELRLGRLLTRLSSEFEKVMLRRNGDVLVFQNGQWLRIAQTGNNRNTRLLLDPDLAA